MPFIRMVGVPLLHAAVRILPMNVLLLFASKKVYKNMTLGPTNSGGMACVALHMGELQPDGLFFGNCTQSDTALFQSLLDVVADIISAYAEPPES